LAMILALAAPVVAEEPAIDTSQHVVITYMVTGDVPTNKTMTETLPVVNALLTEKVNAELNILWIEWTDYLSKYNLTIASQDGNIDLIGTATDWLDAWPNAINGGFMELTPEMLQTYAPLTWAQVPTEHWELCKLDGKIYLIPEDYFAQWTNHGFMYRGDWAKEAGLANGVHSWTDMGAYFQYVKDSKPDVIPWDAKPDASIVAQLTGGWNSSHTTNIYIEGLHVDLFFGESFENKTALSRYFLEGDEFINFAKNQRAWSEAGYWKEDVLNNTSIDTRKEMETGISGADQHHSMTYYGGEYWRMADLQPGSDLGFFWFGEETGNLISLNITHGAMAIGARSKNPERALMVYDLLRNDEELYLLFNYGIEGVQYIKDGKTFTRPEGYNSDTDGSGFNYWWGRNDDLVLVSPEEAVDQRDALVEAYEAVAHPYPYGQVVFDIDPISSELDNLSNLYNTYMPQIVFGKQADPEAYVAEFRAQLKAAGYERCLEEVERQLAAVYQ
ncbi:MAG: ABC transporter substrate-binding protein, partial [Oscillospiraceae bacterium]|nr:ABC transporter substrate-binding protein [Oscillospiraceae bacterium]